MKKITACLLALCLIFSMAACSVDSSELLGGVSGLEPTPTPVPTEAPAATTDFAALYAAYEPDAVVMTVNGSEVKWTEYFYWCYSVAASIESYVGAVDYSAPAVFDETQTYGQYVASEAMNMVLQYHSIVTGAEKAGLELTEADLAKVAEKKAADIVSYCGEGATEADFEAYLAAMYLDVDTYDFFTQVAEIYAGGLDKLYGEMAKDYSDEDVMAYAAENGYMTARHILLLSTDAEGEALPEDELAAKKATAEDIAAQLAAEEDKEKRLELFESLWQEYDEDTAQRDYPGGYCFTPSEMVEQFSDAAAALGEYEVSGVVETDYGYHIILRMPTTPGDVIQYNSAEEQYDLRYVAASAAYDVLTNGWMEDAQVVWSAGFEGYAFGSVG